MRRVDDLGWGALLSDMVEYERMVCKGKKKLGWSVNNQGESIGYARPMYVNTLTAKGRTLGMDGVQNAHFNPDQISPINTCPRREFASTTMSWHRYADSILDVLPKTPSPRCQHKSFNNIFRSSRLATIPRITKDETSFLTRHERFYPMHQVLTTFTSAQRRGDWGLKRPLPQVKDAHVSVFEFDTQERQTPFTFASEKPRFVRRMRELGLTLAVSSPYSDPANKREYRFEIRRRHRPRSPLEHLHPQWNRKTGNESGPNILKLNERNFNKFLHNILQRRQEINEVLKSIKGEKHEDTIKQVVQAVLDIPTNRPVFRTHPTAGLVYSANGYMASTPNGTQAKTENAHPGRMIPEPGTRESSIRKALVYGIVGRVIEVPNQVPSRRQPVALRLKSANVNPFGRLEIVLLPVGPLNRTARNEGPL